MDELQLIGKVLGNVGPWGVALFLVYHLGKLGAIWLGAYNARKAAEPPPINGSREKLEELRYDTLAEAISSLASAVKDLPHQVDRLIQADRAVTVASMRSDLGSVREAILAKIDATYKKAAS